MSLLDSINNNNLFHLVEFLKFSEMIDIKQFDDCKEIMEIYGILVSKVKGRDYKLDEQTNILYLMDDLENFLDIWQSIPEKLISLKRHKEMLSNFIELSIYQQSNIIAIFKFIHSYKKHYLDKDTSFWTHLLGYFRDYSHGAWQDYNEIVEKIKVFPIDGNI